MSPPGEPPNPNPPRAPDRAGDPGVEVDDRALGARGAPEAPRGRPDDQANQHEDQSEARQGRAEHDEEVVRGRAGEDDHGRASTPQYSRSTVRRGAARPGRRSGSLALEMAAR